MFNVLENCQTVFYKNYYFKILLPLFSNFTSRPSNNGFYSFFNNWLQDGNWFWLEFPWWLMILHIFLCVRHLSIIYPYPFPFLNSILYYLVVRILYIYSKYKSLSGLSSTFLMVSYKHTQFILKLCEITFFIKL